MHSHHSSDHDWGDSQFDGRPDTAMIKPDLDHPKTFFAFTKWPEETRTFDLGDRPLDPSVGTILELDRALALMDAPRRLALRDLTIYPMDRKCSKELRTVSRATQDKDKAEVWK